MNTATIQEEIRAFLIQKTGADPAKVNDASTIIGAGLVDSFGLVALLAEVEQKFGVFPDLMTHDPAEYATLGGLTKIILSALNLPEETVVESTTAGSQGAEPLSEIEIKDLNKSSPHWLEVPPLLKRMFDDFGAQGLRLPLVAGGENLWLQALERLPEAVYHVIGAVAGGRLVGFASGHLKMLPAHLGGGFVGEISYVYVSPEWRRAGVAGRLVAPLEQWLLAGKARSIEIQVLAGNEGAQAFWRRKGFSDELLQMRK
ncbi:GNAT family N-acetyltransferase [Prosthecobacter sp.]|uniref:GNAT family N-acetyltransferase n=1 Tax=Prosthecobacter sp. TaxID=1965333 RepID=UPI0037849FBB